MKLNLGSSDRHMAGFVSVDLVRPANAPDDFVCADLAQTWPWDDSSVDEILAFDCIEHLPDKIHTLNELWRVLKPGGIARITVPHATDGDGGHCDPTHKSYFVPSTFDYFEWKNENWVRFREAYGIRAAFRVLTFDTTRRVPRRRGYTVEISVVLEAVKQQ